MMGRWGGVMVVWSKRVRTLGGRLELQKSSRLQSLCTNMRVRMVQVYFTHAIDTQYAYVHVCLQF